MFTLNQSYNLNISDMTEWEGKTLEELKDFHKQIHAEFNDAQILVNVLATLDNALMQEIQDRELAPENQPVSYFVHDDEPIAGPAEIPGTVTF